MKTFVISLHVILGICLIIGSLFVDSGDSVHLIFLGSFAIGSAIFMHFYVIYKKNLGRN